MTVKLDRHPARALTSREIAKILCGALGGFLSERKDQTLEVLDMLRILRDIQCRSRDFYDVLAELSAEDPLFKDRWPRANEHPGWRALLGGIVGSFDAGKWCSVRAVDEALTWVIENWDDAVVAARGMSS